MRQTTHDIRLSSEARPDSPLTRARRRAAPSPHLKASIKSPSELASLSRPSLSPSPASAVAASTVVSEARAPRRASVSALSSLEQARVQELLAEPMDYIDHAEYHLPGAAERIYGAAEITRPDVTWYRPLMDDFISTRSRGLRTPKTQSSVLLTGAQERVLFMKYNFARFSISEIQKQVASRTPTVAEAREMLRWHDIAMQYRQQLAETNLALVLAMAKRVRLSEVDFADLIGEGNMALMRSVDKFDCGRGFKFSTYACRAILKAFSRHGIKVTTQRKRFGAEFDPALEKSNHLETVRATHERECADEVRHIVTANKADLSDIEIKVIGHRFGLDIAAALDQGAGDPNLSVETTSVPAEPLTLEQVGQVIGVTKERVRQIQNKALEKIRAALQAANPDAAGEMAADLAARQSRVPLAAN